MACFAAQGSQVCWYAVTVYSLYANPRPACKLHSLAGSRGLTRGGVAIVKAIKVVVAVVDSPVVAGVVWRVVRNEDKCVPARISAQVTQGGLDV